MVALPCVREEQHGVFTAAQAAAVGVTRHRVQRLLGCGELVALRRGVYVDRVRLDTATVLDRSRIDAVAACLAWPGSVISHHSAALIHGLPLLGSRPGAPALTVGLEHRHRGHRSHRLILRVAALPPDHVRPRGCWRVTTVERTLADLARQFGVRFALPAADFALHRGDSTPSGIQRVFDDCAAWPDSSRLLPLLRLANGAAESPYESLARWELAQSGVPAIPGVWCYDRGGPIGCGDLWVQNLWAFVEIDGDVKYLDPTRDGSLLAEKLRQERMEEAGFGVARIAARQVEDRALLVTRLERASARGALVRAAAPGAVGYVGPPPPWAKRGSRLPVTRPG